jgi:hypothetical protein
MARPPPPPSLSSSPSSPQSEASNSGSRRPPGPRAQDVAGAETTSGPVVASRRATLVTVEAGNFMTSMPAGPPAARSRTSEGSVVTARPPPPPPPDLDAAFDDAFDVDVDDDSVSGFSISAPEPEEEAEERTMIAPAATPSIPAGDTAKQPARRSTEMAHAPTRIPSSRFAVPDGRPPLRAVAPPPARDESQESEEEDEHTAIVSNVPDLSAEREPPRRQRSSESDEPEFADASGFQMVGEDGRTYGDDNNPVAASTRMIPAQALQTARPVTDEATAPPAAAEPEGATETFTAERMREIMKSMESQQSTTTPPPTPSTAPTLPLPALVPGRGRTVVDAQPRSRRPPSELSEPPDATTTPNRRGAQLPPSEPPQAPVQAVQHLLIVDAPDGASVAINGKVMGAGRVTVELDANAKALVRVELAGFSPWSSVVKVEGRPRVRVRPTLKPKAH